MEFGPREEKEATIGAVVSLIATLFSILACGFLKNTTFESQYQNYVEYIFFTKLRTMSVINILILSRISRNS
jgi:hypothetical protein